MKSYFYLPFPYDDELLYSVLARYCSESNRGPHKLACVLFGKCFLILRADLPCALSSVANKTWPTWGMSAETILRAMTLFPYYEPFLPEKARENRKQALISGPCRSNIGTKAFRVSQPIYLRFCVQCRAGDLHEFEETYWRRVHQLPGVLVCPDHGTPLISTCARIQPRRTECIDAATAAVGNAESLEDMDIKLVQKIAQRCGDVLFGKKLLWNRNNSATAYRDAALERGVQSLPGVFSPKVFMEEFIVYYGRPLLAKLGVLPARSKVPWVWNIFQDNKKQVFHPLEHILVQLYLESLPKICSAYPFGLGPWMCPNPYAIHTENFPIKKLSIWSRQDKTYYGRAQCSCGFTFTTDGLDARNPQMPIVDKISSYGCTRYRYAQTMLQSGSTFGETAKALHLTPSQLQSILDAGSKECEDPQSKVLEARKEWLELLCRDPDRRVTVARKKNYGLYQFLRKYDNAWISDQKEPRKPKVDWQSRDAEWSLLITNTAKRLGEGAPKTVVTRAAGLNPRIFSQFDRLPLCAKALQKDGVDHE